MASLMAKTSEKSTSIERVEPGGTPIERVRVTVLSQADPAGPSLLAARTVVNRSKELSAAFTQSREEKWGAERLAKEISPILAEQMDMAPDNVWEVARYLADEYEQVGDGILLVDRVTGRAIARVTDEDLWQPEDVPRESGELVKPLPRLKPEIEGFLIHQRHADERDERILAHMTAQARLTGLVRGLDDRRLLPVTRAGRKQFVEELRDYLPQLLKERLAGTSARFMRAFELRESEGDSGFKTIEAMVRIPVQDPTTFNLHHNRFATVSHTIANEWVRTMARLIVKQAVIDGAMPEDRSTSTEWVADLDPGVSCAASPEVAKTVASLQPLYVLDLDTILCASFPAGTISIKPGSYTVETREVFDRWEILATVEAAFSVNLEQIRLFKVEPPVPEIAAEIVN